MDPYANRAPDVGRDMQGIDQCLDRLGELREKANIIREHLERMDRKLYGSKGQLATPTAKGAPEVLSNVEELEQKITDLNFLLNTMRDYISSINNFINADIN